MRDGVVADDLSAQGSGFRVAPSRQACCAPAHRINACIPTRDGHVGNAGMGTMGFAARGWRRGGGLRVGGVSKVEPWAYHRVKRVEDVFSINHACGVVFFRPNGRSRPNGTAGIFWHCSRALALSARCTPGPANVWGTRSSRSGTAGAVNRRAMIRRRI